MLAYNARYLAIAALIRELHRQYREKASSNLGKQVRQLQRRLEIIKQMQASAILSFLFSALCMLLIYLQLMFWANLLFGISLLCLIISLILSFIDVQLSTKALGIQLSDMRGDITSP
jgi:ABC-type bacteriocin/lantibiotic exporter with double-glycine peptidase domain